RWPVGIFPVCPPGMTLDDPDWEPIWAAAQEHDLTVVIHSFTMSIPYPPGMWDNWDNMFLVRSASHVWNAQRNMAALIGSGVLDRFPNLRLTSLECGHGWLAFWASRLDEQAEMSQHALPRLKRKPSEYIRGPQYFQSIQLHEGELSLRQAIEAIGEDTLMFATDYPHSESWFPKFDVSELSLSTYTVLRGRGEPLVAVPVFPSFSFRHSSIFVGAAAGITAPKDLIGKRVGVPKYHMTAAVWIRGMLDDEYGVAPKDIHWFEGGEGSLVKEVDVTLPPDVRRESVPAGRNLGDMVAAGELDAFVGARRPAAFGERVRRLFPDFRRVERAYYEKTGIFPIMHTLVLKEELARQHPWLPRSLYDAFVEAKRRAYQRLQFTAALPVSLPWL